VAVVTQERHQRLVCIRADNKALTALHASTTLAARTPTTALGAAATSLLGCAATCRCSRRLLADRGFAAGCARGRKVDARGRDHTLQLTCKTTPAQMAIV
jgi:hypothetical protein